MAEKPNSRTRLICLIELMTMYSDQNNILSADEICKKLNEYGYAATKRTVLSDIKAINTTPFKIISVSKPKRGYYLAKSFSQASIDLIIEAIISSRILSENDIDYAIRYLRNNACLPTIDLILSTNQTDFSTLPQKEKSFDCLYTLRVAIRDKKQVALSVSRISPGDGFSLAEKNEEIIVNPLEIITDRKSPALICSLADSPEKAKFINLSRIKSVSILDENSADFSGDKADATSYFCSIPTESKLISAEWILIKIKSEDVEMIESCFSSPVQFRNSKDEGYCIAKALVNFDANLIGKLFILSDRIEILKPDGLKEYFIKKAELFKA